MKEDQDWVDVGTIEDVPPRGARLIKAPQGPVALFRTADDVLFALDDRCPHRGGPLSQGIVHGHCVTCPLHNLVINLETGNTQQPEDGRVSSYKVEQRDGRILLNLRALPHEDIA
ncbi:MAG: nitrite reductase small subunit NirD [Alphaproteobacteria bacterium]|nr:nitrite reductase small subunit NirD [Alphaproteobacteria bacterium]